MDAEITRQRPTRYLIRTPPEYFNISKAIETSPQSSKRMMGIQQFGGVY